MVSGPLEAQKVALHTLTKLSTDFQENFQTVGLKVVDNIIERDGVIVAASGSGRVCTSGQINHGMCRTDHYPPNRSRKVMKMH
jgi:hypothetical protein